MSWLSANGLNQTPYPLSQSRGIFVNQSQSLTGSGLILRKEEVVARIDETEDRRLPQKQKQIT